MEGDPRMRRQSKHWSATHHVCEPFCGRDGVELLEHLLFWQFQLYQFGTYRA